jgi:hypothetical protein
MSRTRQGSEGKQAIAYLVAVILMVFAGTAWGAAQFHMPKIPKLGKSQSQPTEQKKETKGPAVPAAEITDISPNSASPGSEGDIVLTGKNFTDGTKLRMNCPDEAPSISSFKVESPTRAVAHLKFGYEMKEGPCEIYIEVRPVPGAQGEMAASTPGTTEVVQVKGPGFTISKSSGMPVALPVIFVGEGDMQFMDVMMKVQQAMQGSWNDAGKPVLLVSQKELKLNQGDKTIFTEPAANVKDVGQMSMMGQSVGVFRVVFTDGKIYNFMEQSGQGLPPGKAVEIIKATVGK